jgi:7,8-dihydro-6-hydroxymethylpterin-pyrophosphokinase
MDSGELTIPHPRYQDRRFVLAPLAELNPTLRDPRTGRTVTEMLSSVEGQAIRRKGVL